MSLDNLRDKIRRVEHLSSAWIKHGEDEHTIVGVMRDSNALMKKKKTTKAEELLDQLIKTLGAVQSARRESDTLPAQPPMP